MDPSLLQLAKICKTDASALRYAQEHDLIADVTRTDNTPCTYTPNCGGKLYQVIVEGYPRVRCNRCKKKRSVYNGAATFGLNDHTKHSWLVNVDGRERPQMKLPLRARLLLLWCWSKNLRHTQVKEHMSEFLASGRNGTIAMWYNFIGIK